MADNVTARKDSDWIVVYTTPDVCKTPEGSSTPPIPYRVTAKLEDAAQPVLSVNANGKPVVVLTQSFIPKTIGDEKGTAKGVQSGTVADICEPLAHSSSVKAGKHNILRHDDQFYMNNKNTVGKIVGQPPSAKVPAAEANPPVVPETSEEMSGWAWPSEINKLQAEGGHNLFDKINTARDSYNAWSQTPEGIGTSAAWAASFKSPDDAPLFREYVSNIAGPKGVAVFDRKYNKGLAVWMQNIPILLGAGSAIRGSSVAGRVGTFGKPGSGPAIATESRTVMANGAILGEKPKLPGKVSSGGTVKEEPKPPQNKNGSEQPSINGCIEGDPVDMVTGDFLQHLPVLSLPGTLPLTLNRFYRSRATHHGLFGPKWMDDWSCFLELDAHDVHFIDHEGVKLTYSLPNDGLLKGAINTRVSSYVLSGDVKSELTVFDRRTQQTLVFGERQGNLRRLSAIHDGYGNNASFHYQQGQLIRVTHSDGYHISLDWDEEHLTDIALTANNQAQRLATCRYDAQGRLIECDTFQYSHRWHCYSPEGWMLEWRDVDGTQITLCYDSLGRVIQTHTPEGYHNDQFIYNPTERHNTYIDAEGGETHYWYNEDGLAIRRIDPLGREQITVWENNLRKSVTDALGRVTAWKYNRYGDVTRLSLPSGAFLYYRYDENGRIIRFQGLGNKIWLFDYDAFGGLTQITDPQGHTHTRQYGERGN